MAQVNRVFTFVKGKYTFVCWGFNSNRSWGHECRLLINGYESAKERYTYLNRTWESYMFQSVMQGAFENYKVQELERYYEEYKLINGIKRFKTGEKKKLTEEFYEKHREEFDEISKALKEGTLGCK